MPGWAHLGDSTFPLVPASSAIWLPVPGLPTCSKVTNYLLIARTNKLPSSLIVFDLPTALHALLNPFWMKPYPPAAARRPGPMLPGSSPSTSVPGQAPLLVPFLPPFPKRGPAPRFNPWLNAVFIPIFPLGICFQISDDLVKLLCQPPYCFGGESSDSLGWFGKHFMICLSSTSHLAFPLLPLFFPM